MWIHIDIYLEKWVGWNCKRISYCRKINIYVLQTLPISEMKLSVISDHFVFVAKSQTLTPNENKTSYYECTHQMELLIATHLSSLVKH